jgi:hypothetical protein
MTRSPQSTTTSRIIVGWQSHHAIDLSVEAATLLAAATHAEVVGLFVENDALIELAELPFVRAVGVGDRPVQPVSREAMVTAYARGAAVCRRVLSAQAGKAQVKWSFSAERGELPAMIKTIAAAGDFVVISGDIHGFGAQQLMRELRSSPTDIRGILIAGLQKLVSQNGPVIAIDDGDKKGEQTIKLAALIAAARNVNLVIFAVAATDAEANDIVHRAVELSGANVTLSSHRIPPGMPQLIASAASALTPSFIIGDREGEPFGDDRAVLSLLRACKGPVLLLR